MSLAPGTRLGPYEILGLLGKGGMGEVYRARDSRMSREVGIKVSAEKFSARFSREVHAIAALNHPNVCTIHDVGEDYLVMELVEGPTLAERIAAGPIQVDEALLIAGQIAAALEAAHEKGIVHRDLKPGNIKLRPDGAVKVLDFGLAKSGGTAAAPPGEDSPTVSLQATQAGVILGTAAYMAPEQARGKAVDKRADIWSFGVVLYEMVTGGKPFHGEDLTDMLASVVKVEPDLSAAPVRVRRLLKKCLEKDPKRRLRDIGDMQLLIEDEESPEVNSGGSSRQAAAGWIAAGLIAIAGVSGWWTMRRTPGVVSPDLAFSINPGPGILARGLGSPGGRPLISPDGSAVIFQGNGLQLRRFNALDFQRVQVKGMRNSGFWGRDSQTFLFGDAENLNRMRAPDGAIEIVGKNLPGLLLGGSVSEGGTVLISAIKALASLYTVPFAGGDIKPVSVDGLPAGTQMLWPSFTGSTDDFLFIAESPTGENAIYLATMRDGKANNAVKLMDNDAAGNYTPAGGGRMLFVKDDNLYSQKLDLTGRKLMGDPDLVQRRVASVPGYWEAQFTVSRTGSIAWRPGTAALSQITIRDRSGTELGKAGPPLAIQTLRLSPDESHLLAVSQNNVFVLEPNRLGLLKLARGTASAQWLPDGSVLDEAEGSNGGTLVRRSIGGGQAQEFPAPQGFVRAQDVSPDGKTLLFNRGVFDTGIFSAPLNGGGSTAASLVRTGETILNPQFSPDGRWILYEARSPEGSGDYIQPFPGSGVRKQIPNGNYPRWRRDGREILYLAAYQGRPHMWSLPVTADGAEFRLGEPKPLFEVRPPATTYNDLNFWAVSRDGSRFYLPEGVEQPDPDSIYIRTGAIR